jgi:hypothetical protein
MTAAAEAEAEARRNLFLLSNRETKQICSSLGRAARERRKAAIFGRPEGSRRNAQDKLPRPRSRAPAPEQRPSAPRRRWLDPSSRRGVRSRGLAPRSPRRSPADPPAAAGEHARSPRRAALPSLSPSLSSSLIARVRLGEGAESPKQLRGRSAPASCSGMLFFCLARSLACLAASLSRCLLCFLPSAAPSGCYSPSLFSGF